MGSREAESREGESNPRGSLERLTRVLQDGGAAIESDQLPAELRSARLLLLGAIGIALFGAASGFAGGGRQIAVAAAKHLLVAAGSIALAAPSLLVLSALDGAIWPGASFGRALVRVWAVVGIGLAALAPIVFVFASGSRLLASVVLLSVASLFLAALLARRLLRSIGVRGITAGFWLVLLLLVVFQGATLARPILVRGPGEPLWTDERLGFFEQLGRSCKVRLRGAVEQEE